MRGKTNLKTSLTMLVFLFGIGLVANTNVCKSDDTYIVVDDMEDYNDRDELRLVWTDGYASVNWGVPPSSPPLTGATSGSNLSVSTAVGGPVYAGAQSMVLYYDNDGYTYVPGFPTWPYTAPCYSEVEANTIGPNSLDIGVNWNAEGIKAIALNYVGHSISNDAEQLYVALSDSTHTVVVNHPDPNAVTLTDWQEWNIELTEFSDLGLNLSDVQKVHVGLGDRVTHPDPGGSGIIYIDDIVFYKHYKCFFVDTEAPAGGDGTSWANAFNYLQDALAATLDMDEIYVAGGTYFPDQGGGNTSGDREATFQLINRVRIKGGYAGLGEPDPNARDIKLYKTILSGDLNGDDGPDFANNGENSYHVITCSGVGGTAVLDGFTGTAVLDGFTITAGNANGPTLLDGRGGGMLCYANGSPTIKRCRFNHNSAVVYGGAIYCQYGSQSNPTITDCIFTANTANSQGGAMYNHGTCDPSLSNCLFNGNFTPGHGGGIFNYNDSSPTLTNCTLTGNSAGSNGGGLYNFSGSNPTLTNCILWGNSDSGGYVEYSQITDSNNNTTINYSCVQGWTGSFGGSGNIGDDPIFKDTDGPDDILGTEDDDLRLSAGSPCIDAGDNMAVPASVVVDLDGNPRFFDIVVTFDTGNGAPPIVDMGAYEFNLSLVAHWRLDEVVGNIAHDSSGNSHHGTAQSTPTRVDGPPGYGRAMYFDGGNPTPAWVDCGTWNPSAKTGKLTVALWIRWDGPIPGVWQGVIGKRDTWDEQATQMMWVIEVSEQNQVISFSRAGCYPWCGDVVLPEGEWSHVAVTFDGSTMIFYVNGLETGRGDFSFGAKTDSTLRFGSHELGYGGFHGALDDIRLYNYALSAGEVRWLLCEKPPRGDVNHDCRFDFVDLAMLLSEWLDCGMMIPELCVQ